MGIKKIIKKIFNVEFRASITVEATLSFTLMVFILFMMLGPLLIIKTSSDLMVDINNDSKSRCNYELIKTGLEDLKITQDIKDYVSKNEFLNKHYNKIEDFFNYATSIINIYNKNEQRADEFKNIKTVLGYNLFDDIYDKETGIVRFDYLIIFNLPYNVLHVPCIETRFINIRRAFIGADPNRFGDSDENGQGGYFIARNHIYSKVYHNSKNCSYLQKNTEQVIYADVGKKRNDAGGKYDKCPTCFKNISINSDTICFITKYGDRFHYTANCPRMTAYVEEVDEEYISEHNLSLCSRCTKQIKE